MDLEQLSESSGFEWDEGNSEKNWAKHRVTRFECEQIFFNLPFVVADDQKHSHGEPRCYALGQTDRGRKLFVVFTMRDSLIRVISARNMNRAERRIYDEKENSGIRE
ncbi:MAG: BrnT family toxin [Syntrophobacteraceae bacterium]